MPSERTLSPEVLAMIAAELLEPVVFLFADFPSQPRRIWTGKGDYNDGTNVWTGVGGIIGIESISETVDTGAQGLKVSLNGLDQDLVNQLTSDAYQKERCEILLGFWDRTSTNAPDIVMLPEPLWRGVLDADDVMFSAKAANLTIYCEHRLVDILRKREWRYTDRDQQLLNPGEGDTGLSKIEQIQDLEITWGRTQA